MYVYITLSLFVAIIISIIFVIVRIRKTQTIPIKKQTIKEMTAQFTDILYKNPKNIYARNALFYIIENICGNQSGDIDDYTLYDILNALLFCCDMYYDDTDGRSELMRKIIDVYYKCRLTMIKELKIYYLQGEYQIKIHIYYHMDGENGYRMSKEHHMINYDTYKYIINTWHHHKMTYYFYNKSKIKQVKPIEIDNNIFPACSYRPQLLNFGLAPFNFQQLEKFEKIFI